MAAFVIKSEYVEINSVDLSTYVKSATLNTELSVEDSTTMTDTWSEQVAGIRSASLDIEFVDDFANGLLDDLQWALFIADSAVTFEVRPTSAATSTSNPQFTGSLFVNQHSVGGAHGSLAMKSVTYPVTGAVTRADVMPTFRSMQAYSAEVDAMHRDLENDFRRSIAFDMAKAGQKIARRAASDDLGGDPKFSGWRPRLATQVRRTRDGAVLMPTRSFAGPWTVAEIGRNQGNAPRFQGPGINRRTGLTSRTKTGKLRRVRAVRAKRWNGYTKGFGTASDAHVIMDKELPKIADRQSRKVMQRRFDVT